MFRAIRKDARTIIVAVVAATVTAGAPAVAHGVHAAFAHNADKVDNKHAVASGASLSSARGKLVAHDTTGKLPAKFIPKVADSDKLDGIDSTGFLSVTGKAADADKLDGRDSATYLPGGTIPAGVTIRGSYAVGGEAAAASEFAWSEIQFNGVLVAAPATHVMLNAAAPTAACPGSVTDPQAAPGNLCFYERFHVGNPTRVPFKTSTGAGNASDTWGAGIAVVSGAAGRYFSYGSWAVTAPTSSPASSASSTTTARPVGR